MSIVAATVPVIVIFDCLKSEAKANSITSKIITSVECAN